MAQLTDEGTPRSIRLKDGPLAQVLMRKRADYNARFNRARGLRRGLDAEAFSTHLTTTVDDIVRVAFEFHPDGVESVVDALYDLSLELVGRNCIGPATRYPAMDRAWRTLLTNAPGMLVPDPLRMAGAVSNAVFNLERTPGADADQWLETMGRLAWVCPDLDTFFQAGQAAAWRWGMAHYRESALEVWRRLPNKTAYMVLGLDVDQTDIKRGDLEEALSDPWRRPESAGRNIERRLAITVRTGGFRGFGGPFSSPPEVTVSDDVFYVYDSSFCWSMHADCFGAVIQRFGRDLPPDIGPGSNRFSLDQSGQVRFDGGGGRFPELRDWSSFAATETTLAVTLKRSHYVFIIALAEESV